MDPEIEFLKIIEVLVDCGVPISTANRAVMGIRDGGTTREAINLCLAALPSMDPAMIALAEGIVASSELAVWEREHEKVKVERAGSQR